MDYPTLLYQTRRQHPLVYKLLKCIENSIDLKRDDWIRFNIFRLPEPTVSHFKYVPEVIGDGLTIGFIAYAISYSMAKILADRHGYRINANQVRKSVC